MIPSTSPFASASLTTPAFDGPAPVFIEERKANHAESLTVQFRGVHDCHVTVPMIDRLHPNKADKSRLNRQKSRILLRWSAAGQDISPLRLANACRSLGIVGEDRHLITGGQLRAEPKPKHLCPSCDRPERPVKAPAPLRLLPKPIIGPAFVQPTHVAA